MLFEYRGMSLAYFKGSPTCLQTPVTGSQYVVVSDRSGIELLQGQTLVLPVVQGYEEIQSHEYCAIFTDSKQNIVSMMRV